MNSIDWTQLFNWIIPGFLGLIFGVAGSYVTYWQQRKRDEINWQREKEKMDIQLEFEKDKIRKQQEHEKEVLAITFAQRIQELEINYTLTKGDNFRRDLLKELKSPEESSRIKIAADVVKVSPVGTIDKKSGDWVTSKSIHHGPIEVNRLFIDDVPHRIISLKGESLSIMNEDNLVTLEVRGNSMNLIGIEDGDFVIVRRQDTAEHGDIVLAESIGLDTTVTIKRLYISNAQIRLVPESTDPSYKPFEVSKTDNIRILGVITGVLKPIV